MDIPEEKALMHYGTKRHSGRYPWGSGKNPYQHSGDWMSRMEKYHAQGYSDKDIADMLHISTTELRDYTAIASNRRRQLEVEQAKSLKSDGLNISEIGRKMGKNESTIRSLLNEGREARTNQYEATANMLKEEVERKGIIDVGKGVENNLDISSTKLRQAITLLQLQGYSVFGISVPQPNNPNHQTNYKLLAKPDIKQADVYKDPSLIKNIDNIKPSYHSNDGGSTYIQNQKMKYPASISSDRVQIMYGDQGGKDKDGVIEIRRGVKDLDLGNSSYAQVRILVDGTHYLKGMAMYSDNIPDGYDILFNTNKLTGTPKNKVMKAISTDDPDNPFGGAYIKPDKGQSEYIGDDGKKHLSAINKLREEGDWDTWSRTLSSQFLSKQPEKLIKKQLDLSYKDRYSQFEEIKKLNNPTLKRKMLNDFADECDKAAIELKAAGLPRQKSHVILPITSLKDNEVYAPGYNNGEHVVLIRHPHGGTFEIPELIVNNNHKEAKKILGTTPSDAIGINSSVAERLSGADFDGDTVIVIPVNDRVKVRTSSPLKDLEGFDPKIKYGPDSYKDKYTQCTPNKKFSANKTYYVKDSDGDFSSIDISEAQFNKDKTKYYTLPIKLLSDKQKGNEMGKISNLITDMTLKGAPPEEIARAVRHSMVVIDAPKHKLDYKRSYSDNDIQSLKTKYMLHLNDAGNPSTGASTLISRASAEKQVLKRKGNPNINPVTGEKTYKETSWIDPKTGELKVRKSKEVVERYFDKNGKEQTRTMSSTHMAETNDARTLISEANTRAENLYATFANNLKALANESRKESMATGKLVYNPSAAKEYSAEVSSLNSKLNLVKMNSPRERQAQALATSRARAKIEAGSIEDKELKRKITNQELINARIEVGASGKNTKFIINDREWEAIQAGAIHDTKLSEILLKTDQDELKKRATPNTNKALNDSQKALIRSMANSGYTLKEIADRLGKSTSTISKTLNAV